MTRLTSIALLTPALLFGCVDQTHDLGGAEAGAGAVGGDVAVADDGSAGDSVDEGGRDGADSSAGGTSGASGGMGGASGTPTPTGGSSVVPEVTGGRSSVPDPTGGAAGSDLGTAGSGPGINCVDLDEDACRAAADLCGEVIVLDVGTFVECIPREGCMGSSVCASNGETTRNFADNCVPSAYHIVDSALCEADCAELGTREECEAANDCSAIVSTDGRFWECQSSEMGCPAAMTCASASADAPNYLFPSGCVPTGWESTHDTAKCEQEACEVLGEEECSESPVCAPVLDTEGVYRGCLSADLSCPPTITCAANDEYDVAEFGGCLPSGWHRLEVEDCSLEAQCAAFTAAAECEAAEGCSAIAPIDGSGSVFYCGATRACPEAETCAVSPDGVARLFPTECLPPGWESVDLGCSP